MFPRNLRIILPAIECHTVPEVGWAGKKNGELLALAEKAGFRVFLTVDRGLEQQHSSHSGEIAIVVMRSKSNRLADLLDMSQIYSAFLTPSTRVSSSG